MNFNETLAFYLVVGIAVAVAHLASERHRGIGRQWLSAVASLLFWPLYLPLVLRSAGSAAEQPVEDQPRQDELAAAIGQVERELDAALGGLDGWAENVLDARPHRLRELRAALAAQAERIRDMEALLERERAQASEDRLPAVCAEMSTGREHEPGSDRWQRSREARRDNMARLERLCARSRSDLLATLAWIRELVSMIHLARFTGAPAARAEELVGQIAAAVESISSLSSAEVAEAVAMPPAKNCAAGGLRPEDSFQGVLP